VALIIWFLWHHAAPEGGGSARPFFHLSICRSVPFCQLTIVPPRPISMSHLLSKTCRSKTCLFLSPLRSVVSRSLWLFISK
jgi:hypothetical protein